MPHYAGRDENGYSHNWWDYLMNMNHVTGLAADEQYGKGKVVLAGGDTLEDVSFLIKYHTGEKKTTTIGESDATVTYKEGGIFTTVDGQIIPTAVGTEEVIIRYDGHALEYTVEVTEVAEKEIPPVATKEPAEENTEKEEPAEGEDADVNDRDVKEENSDEEENEELVFAKKVIEVVKERPLMAVALGTVLCVVIVVVVLVMKMRKKK